jgi:glucosamine kinase
MLLRESDIQLFIGVDGGGTGCRARIEDADGRALGRGSSGPAALRIGIDGSLAAIKAASLSAAADAGIPAEMLSEMHAAIGLSGIGRKGVIEQIMTRSHPFRTAAFVQDAMIACLGAHGGRDGGIVITGTGSVGFALVQGREVRTGGYGFPISDEGSGAELGLQAIRSSLRAHDGRGAETGLTRAMMEKFNNDPFEAVAWMDHATATDYATCAPLVMDHADAGDPIARHIVCEAADDIGALVRGWVSQGAPRIALLGGLAWRMESWLSPDVQRRLVPVEGDAIDGALRLARERASAGHTPCRPQDRGGYVAGEVIRPSKRHRSNS